jgi:hypothetical protein
MGVSRQRTCAVARSSSEPIRMSGRSCVTHSTFGRSTCFILPESGSFTMVVRFQTKRPMYFSSLRIGRSMFGQTFTPAAAVTAQTTRARLSDSKSLSTGREGDS